MTKLKEGTVEHENGWYQWLVPPSVRPFLLEVVQRGLSAGLGVDAQLQAEVHHEFRWTAVNSIPT